MLKIIAKPTTNNISAENFYGLITEYENQEGFSLMDTVINFETCSIAFLSPIKKFELKTHSELINWMNLDAQKYVSVQFNERVPCLAGFLSYESFNEYEKIKVPQANILNTPLACFYLYQDILIYRHKWKQVKHFVINEDESPMWKFSELKSHLTPKFELRDPNLNELENHSNFTKSKYKESISKIIEHIVEGDVYQVNMSQQFDLLFKGKASDLYHALNQINPASFSAYINHDTYKLISNSPELFLNCDGTSLQTAPIKGTILRTENNDEQNKTTLKESVKNLAELSMIVDLERNDLGKIAKAGSVSVQNHGKILSTNNVHHLVSEIICNLETNSLSKIFKAVFPSGSITGAPKIAAMKLISELEDRVRGAYTGSIGYFCTNNSFNFNVAIRTAVIRQNRLIFSAGGGIVADSNPDEEYNETLAKSIAIYKAYLAVSV